MNSIPFLATLRPPFQAAKWMKHPVLLDVDEMRACIQSLGTYWIVQTSGIITQGKELIPIESFLEVYEQYIVDLKQGKPCSDSRMRPFFSSVLTSTLEALYKYNLPAGNNDAYLVKVHLPVIQMQTHTFHYSPADDTFRSMALGPSSISWGIQFSYPHMYQGENSKIFSGKEMEIFPNTLMYKMLQQWIRVNTTVTTLEANGKRKHVPIRLGKKSVSWAKNLPELTSRGLLIV
jgi:hypothetical protein